MLVSKFLGLVKERKAMEGKHDQLHLLHSYLSAHLRMSILICIVMTPIAILGIHTLLNFSVLYCTMFVYILQYSIIHGHILCSSQAQRQRDHRYGRCGML